LAFLYGKEVSESVLPKLSAILDKFSHLPKRQGGGLPFTNKDAFLITYGNILSGPDSETGLARLCRFLKKYNVSGQAGASGNAAPFFSYIHVLPFHPYTSDDGFSVVDYRRVDPRYGDWPDLEKLSELGKPVFDLVINHGSSSSEWFKGFLAGDERYAGWYLTRPQNYDYGTVVRPRTSPLLTAFEKADGSALHVWTTFSADQVDYDFSNPRVLLEFVTILLEYASRGARIIRLDAIAYLWKEDGTACLHHPKTHAVVKLFRAVIDALDLPVLLLTETNVPHAENISYFGKAVGVPAIDALPEAHMVYNFALPPLCLYAAVSGDAGPLRAWAKTLPGPEKKQYFLNFLASHDGVGLTPAKGLVDDARFAAMLDEAKKRGALVSYKATPAGDVPYELNCSYASVAAPPGESAETRAKAFLACHGVLLSLSGLPAIYFHSWTGSEAWTEGPALLGYNRAINREKPDIGKVMAGLDDPSTFRYHVYHGLQKLIAFRQNESAFSPDATQIILEAEGPVFAVERRPANGGSPVLCVENLSSRPAKWRDMTLAPWETYWKTAAK